MLTPLELVQYPCLEITAARQTVGVQQLHWVNHLAQTEVVFANGYAYQIGGWNGSAPDADVRYARVNSDGTLDSWSDTTDLPEGRSNHEALFYNGYIYVTGGYDGTEDDDVLYAKVNIDGTLAAWTRSTNHTTNEQYNHLSVIANGYLFVLGGQGSSRFATVAKAPVYPDGSIGSFTTTTSIPQISSQNYTNYMEGTYANGYIYIVGGILDTNNGTSEVRYARVNSDGTLGSWTTAAEAATVYLGGTVTASNGYLYTFGGKDFGGGAVTYNTVHYAKLLNSGETGAWATSTNTFTTARWEHASFMANGYAYILGGASNTAGTTLVSTVRYARLSGVLQVGGDLDLVGIQAGNLANGGIGGSLTANNGMFTGSLNVLGSSIFNQAVSVNGTLNVSDAVAVAGSISGASSATLGTSTTNGTLTLLNSTNAFGVTLSAANQ